MTQTTLPPRSDPEKQRTSYLREGSTRCWNPTFRARWARHDPALPSVAGLVAGSTRSTLGRGRGG